MNEIEYWECECGYRMADCQWRAIKCDPECPACGNRLASDFTPIFYELYSMSYESMSYEEL